MCSSDLLLADPGISYSRGTTELEGIHGPVNLGNPTEMTVKDIARLVIRLTGSSSPVEHLPRPTDDPKVRRPDIGRARNLLGWEPHVDAETGLTKTIAYFQSILADLPDLSLDRADSLATQEREK